MRKDNKNNETGIQNRFTAYLTAAVRNKRITYMEKKKRVRKNESYCMDILEKGYTDFEQEYHRYLCQMSQADYGMEFNLQRLLRSLDEQRLVKALLGLKKREQEVLMARVYGNQNFSEIGIAHGLTAK